MNDPTYDANTFFKGLQTQMADLLEASDSDPETLKWFWKIFAVIVGSAFVAVCHSIVHYLGKRG